ncbi:uncharacterized protein LOC107224395 isoform X1 [Neodiprion lecontei]|uniref:Uncharacterized protein LOC107224395 isoform X1 n=1 Tax=Neodiprion lecontei TaxID=441921 RepID=A0A6J0C057_NEOLC|nr:uncharacterized protein LOC107224395 isoform X1 [Neodiprion lecontei]
MEQYEQYIALRKEFLSEAKLYLTRSDVIALKIRHQQAINSVRTYESIENIEQLVRVLEKRGVIRYDKIQLLKNIAQNFPHHSMINTKFNKYMAWLENYTPYPPETNLYKCLNGECYRGNKIINNLFSSENLNSRHHPRTPQFQSFVKYKFLPESSLTITTGDDLSDSNNSVMLICSNADVGNHVSFANNFNFNNNDTHETNNDLNLCVTSQETPGILKHQKGNLIPNVTSSKAVSAILISKNDNIKSELSLPMSEELNLSETNFNIPLLSTPQSHMPPTTCSSHIDDTSLGPSPIQSKSKENFNEKQTSLRQFVQKRQTLIVLSLVLSVIILSILCILYGFLPNSVHYIPEPSAPPSQVVNPGFAEGSRIPYARNDPNKETEIRNISDRQNYQWYPSTSESVMYSSYSQTQPEDQQKIMYTVFNGVSEAVGKSWRDVARYLDVREGDIDRIDTQFNSDSKEKAFAALKIFAAKSDLRCWSINLKNALEKARRKDLRNLVDDLLTRK